MPDKLRDAARFVVEARDADACAALDKAIDGLASALIETSEKAGLGEALGHVSQARILMEDTLDGEGAHREITAAQQILRALQKGQDDAEPCIHVRNGIGQPIDDDYRVIDCPEECHQGGQDDE